MCKFELQQQRVALPEAITAAEEALHLSEGEDTLAGLGKVVALAGDHDHARARDLYQRSLDRAQANRRPLRRAALGLTLNRACACRRDLYA